MARGNRQPRSEAQPGQEPQGSQIPSPQASPAPQSAGEQQAPQQPAPAHRSKQGIEVVALRKGFFANDRKKAGDVFTVPSMDHLGMWMKCTDPKAQAEHEKRMKQKKQKARG